MHNLMPEIAKFGHEEGGYSQAERAEQQPDTSII